MSPGFNPTPTLSLRVTRAPERKKCSATQMDADRLTGLPVRRAAATQRDRVGLASSQAAIEADRNKHTATGERLSVVGGTRVKPVFTNLWQLF